MPWTLPSLRVCRQDRRGRSGGGTYASVTIRAVILVSLQLIGNTSDAIWNKTIQLFWKQKKTNLVVIAGAFLICFSGFVHTVPIWRAPYTRQLILLLPLKTPEEKEDKLINVLFLWYKSLFKIIIMYVSGLSKWTEKVLFASLRVLRDLKTFIWLLQRDTGKQFLSFFYS